LLEYLSDHAISLEEHELIIQRDNAPAIAAYSYTRDQWFRRVWFVSEGNRLLMITYNCKSEHKGIEDPKVEKIVESLKVLE
jgi:hypothetical protein